MKTLEDLKKIAEAAWNDEDEFADCDYRSAFQPDLALALLEELIISRRNLGHVKGWPTAYDTAREATDKILGEING